MRNSKLLSLVMFFVAALLLFEFVREIKQDVRGYGTEGISEEALFQETVEDKPVGYFSVIGERNIFGASGRISGRGGSVIQGFRLRGTVIYESGGGYAILEDAATGKQELYRLGDRFAGFILASIEWGKVVLKGAGGEKVFTFCSDPAKGFRRERVVEKVETAGSKHIVPKSLVEKAVSNTNKILTQVRVKPHFVSGIAEGYWVGNIQPGSIIEDFGFQNGDIVKNVNGEVLDGPEKIFSAYREIQETGVVVVDVERDNKIITLTYEIRD